MTAKACRTANRTNSGTNLPSGLQGPGYRAISASRRPASGVSAKSLVSGALIEGGPTIEVKEGDLGAGISRSTPALLPI